MQRLSALMYDHPTFNLSDLNLADYEILCHEPLHDISNHTKNLYNELVHHVPNSIQDRFKQIIQNSFNRKEVKNGSNYRKSLLLAGNWLLETAPEHFVTKIILTMCEYKKFRIFLKASEIQKRCYALVT